MSKTLSSPAFAVVDETEASGILADVVRENNIYLGGASVGLGLDRAARFYLNQQQGDNDDAADDGAALVEDPFFVVDIGVVVSQFYTWRKYLPRVEPFYAVKSNPDPVIVRTLAVLGCHFDCASRNEIDLVKKQSKNLSWQPQIIYANPCKGRLHIRHALQQGVTLMTFDNKEEVQKVAQVTTGQAQMVLRIITDDRGSQCRLSSKFGAPKHKWRDLLKACKDHGLECVGVSFHVGSGCRDASRYHDALKDARAVFDMAHKEFGFQMNLLDIGGGFPGETHSMWNPADHIDETEDEGLESKANEEKKDDPKDDHFLFFDEIATQVAPMIDRLFPDDSVRVIAEPGRYFVAAASTLLASVIGARNNAVDDSFCPDPIDDKEAASFLANMTREDERKIVHGRSASLTEGMDDTAILDTIVEEFNDYSKLFAKQNLAQQEADVYNDGIDIYYSQNFETQADLLGPPTDDQLKQTVHTAEGMIKELVTEEGKEGGDAILALAAAGEAAINGVVLQAVADSAPLQDDYAYYINDGVYSSFNNIMFDHATIRPRLLKSIIDKRGHVVRESLGASGFLCLEENDDKNHHVEHSNNGSNKVLYASTVFGPTCDSIDVIARSVLLPKLKIGDWLYFQNMGAYTMAAASHFNGFAPTERFYVCSVQPEHFEQMIAGPLEPQEEKKDDV